MGTATLALPTSSLPVLPDWITSDMLYEIIDGEYVEKETMSAKAGLIATRVISLINAFARRNLGEASGEVLFDLPGSSRSRRPDAFYISYARWPKGQEILDTDGWRICPELCIEVISPSDRMLEVRTKMREYFAAGVSQVWLVLPDDKQVDVYTGPASHRSYVAGQAVDATAVIPGFLLELADVF